MHIYVEVEEGDEVSEGVEEAEGGNEDAEGGNEEAEGGNEGDKEAEGGNRGDTDLVDSDYDIGEEENMQQCNVTDRVEEENMQWNEKDKVRKRKEPEGVQGNNASAARESPPPPAVPVFVPGPSMYSQLAMSNQHLSIQPRVQTRAPPPMIGSHGLPVYSSTSRASYGVNNPIIREGGHKFLDLSQSSQASDV
ncbi:hypothetical protein Salat_2396700 [Sesamum alatum]|uniref:Uncharacterized protein n=1 Tax=Sesamum alatum TaxID=300844 RepID=A0AAE2CF55_9LAMI|nr:hypothetical protein Salat_2396700 [Sesamum alatum]